MALVLSLSLDLFLMKGNFIAVRVQPETDRGRESDRTSPREVEEQKTKEKGGQNRGMWLTFYKNSQGRQVRPWTRNWTTDNNAIDATFYCTPYIVLFQSLFGFWQDCISIYTNPLPSCNLISLLLKHSILTKLIQFHRGENNFSTKIDILHVHRGLCTLFFHCLNPTDRLCSAPQSMY